MSDDDLQLVIDNLLALNKRYPTPIISEAIHAIAYLREDRHKRLEYAEGIRHIQKGTL